MEMQDAGCVGVVAEVVVADNVIGKYRVMLLNPACLADSPEVAYECETLREAWAWVREWEREPLGLVAVVWPPWAGLQTANAKESP